MLFTNSRSIPVRIPAGSTNNLNVLQHIRRKPNVVRPTPAVVEEPAPTTSTKKMKWGEPTWLLFHTLAHKVRDEAFHIVRNELLDILYTICVNLPCPECAGHATAYMNGINYKTIQSKEQLKDMLFVFHNAVNQRKKVALFNRLDLDTKYNAANLVPIIQNFMNHFRDKHASIHMIANDMHRGRLATSITAWFQQNLRYFDA